MITIYRGSAMNIIFKQNAKEIAEKYTVLDLDTFSLPDGSTHTACCVVESIPIEELSKIEDLKTLHAALIESYGRKDWASCEVAIDELTGKWGGEVDTFYENLKDRINQFKVMNLDESWTPVIPRS
jgi:hypothetical protein